MDPSDSFETNDGWIGSWSPGLGDPTFVGFLTVVVYFVVAVRVFGVRRLLGANPRGFEPRAYALLGLALAVLGVNKQLDLQTAFTEFGRLLAREQGWYDARGDVQRLFIAALLVLGALVVGLLVLFLRNVPRATWIAFVGFVGLVLFVLGRAASFHHVDAFLGSEAGGLRWNWILELGSLGVIGLGAELRRRDFDGRNATERSAPKRSAPQARAPGARKRSTKR